MPREQDRPLIKSARPKRSAYTFIYFTETSMYIVLELKKRQSEGKINTGIFFKKFWKNADPFEKQDKSVIFKITFVVRLKAGRPYLDRV